MFYTQDQMRDVIAYARERGIRVIPEFDMPGHATAWFVGYPELASGRRTVFASSATSASSIRRWTPRASTYQFLDAFYRRDGRIFPDPYFHIGGDEINGVAVDPNPSIQHSDEGAQPERHGSAADLFQSAAVADSQEHGKYMVGWDEIFAPAYPRTS